MNFILNMHLQEGRLVPAYILFLSMALSTKIFYKIICIFGKPKSSSATVGTHNSADLNPSMIFPLLVVTLFAVLIFNFAFTILISSFCCNITMRVNRSLRTWHVMCIENHNHRKCMLVRPNEKHSH